MDDWLGARRKRHVVVHDSYNPLEPLKADSVRPIKDSFVGDCRKRFGGKKLNSKVIQEWIDDLSTSPQKPLSKWEQQFIESISDQFTRSGSLSPLQLEKLEELYEKKG